MTLALGETGRCAVDCSPNRRDMLATDKKKAIRKHYSTLQTRFRIPPPRSLSHTGFLCN